MSGEEQINKATLPRQPYSRASTVFRRIHIERDVAFVILRPVLGCCWLSQAFIVKMIGNGTIVLSFPFVHDANGWNKYNAGPTLLMLDNGLDNVYIRRRRWLCTTTKAQGTNCETHKY